MKKKQHVAEKISNNRLSTGQEEDTKTFIFSDEVWSKLRSNVNSQITDVEVQKTFMQFMEFLCMTLV